MTNPPNRSGAAGDSLARLLSMRRRGRGHAVVFLGGCPTTWDVLSTFAAGIAETHEAVEVAFPGYGASAPLQDRYTLAAAQALLEATLLAAGLRDCSVVAFSGGAYRALALALGDRVAVKRVYLLGGRSATLPDEALAFRQFATALRAGHDLRALAASRFLAPAFAAAHSEAVRAVEEWITATSPDVLAAELEAFAEAPDLTPSLGVLEVPVVARVGALDLATPVALSETIVRACPSARLEVVDGAGHALMYEDEHGSLASIRAWLAR